MSASREKKLRQDLAAQGITDPKLIREAEERAKARKTNTLYGIIAAVFVLVAAAVLVYNSGVLQRGKTAVTIDGEKYTAAQVNYYYMSRKNSILNSGYATYYSQDAGSKGSGALADWLFDSARQSGDCDVVDSDPNTYVVLFHSVGRQTYNTIDVRHILFQPDTTGLNSESETYDADLQARRDEAKAKAEDALAQWKAGDATEDSFAALANELSEDGGSNTNGGLYTKVLKGQMVTEFNDWLFDESRQPGDTGVVYGESSNYAGYHVMYFVGDDVPCWQVQVENTLRSRDTEAWQKGLTDSAEVVELSGMKHVG